MAVKKYTEQMLWLAAMIFLFCLDTSSSVHSFCIFKWMGITVCPGCGIGHAVHYALHLDFQESFHAHIFGVPATILILRQIFKPFITINIHNHGPATTNDVERNSA
ncbi:MAG: DUF2752 domain-containing protein [Ferruginibacter sp.]